MTDRNAYIEKAQARLHKLDAEIERLSARMDEVEADAKGAYRTALEDARAKRRELQDKLDDMKRAGETAWTDLTAGVDNAWSELSEAVEKAAARFR